MIARFLGRAWATSRAQDWWPYKIPPLVAALYGVFLRFDPGAGAWLAGAGAFAAIVMIAVYGYVLNDICDVHADRLAGRPNRMAGMGAAGRTMGTVVPAGAALAIGWWLDDPIAFALIAVNLLLPTAYSCPPLRLKSRGVWGALADAGAAHALPMALVIRAATGGVAATGWLLPLFMASAIAWTFLAGLRGIIVHQVGDEHADRRAGVTTFGGSLDRGRSRMLVLGWLLPLELISLGAFLGLVLPRAPIAAVVVVIWLAIELLKIRRRWTLPLFEPATRSREPYVPVISNEIYELWLPYGLGLQLALETPAVWLLLVAQTVLFYSNIRTRLIVAGRALRAEPQSRVNL